MCYLRRQALRAYKSVAVKFHKEENIGLIGNCEATATLAERTAYETHLCRPIQKWNKGRKQEAKTTLATFMAKYDTVDGESLQPLLIKQAHEIVA